MPDHAGTLEDAGVVQEQTTDFLRSLREEVLHHKERRADFVVRKLGFTVGLFGAGFLGGSTLDLHGLFYAIPFVALAYDVYIWAEDYKVKRVGQFLRMTRYASQCETEWERFVTMRREPLAALASFGLTVMAVVASSCVVYIKASPSSSVRWWFALTGLCSVLVFVYHRLLKRNLSHTSREWRTAMRLPSGQPRPYVAGWLRRLLTSTSRHEPLQKSHCPDRTHCDVTFVLGSPLLDWARKVELVGDFAGPQGWDHPVRMEKRRTGRFCTKLRLGLFKAYQFRFRVELAGGEEIWMNHPGADDYVENPFGTENSVVLTSPTADDSPLRPFILTALGRLMCLDVPGALSDLQHFLLGITGSEGDGRE